MIKTILSTLLTALALIQPAFAASAGDNAQVQFLDTIGYGTVTFSGENAQKLYDALGVKAETVEENLYEKVGKNIACSREVTDNKDGSSTAVYRCGSLFNVASGEMSPDRIATAQPGISIGNGETE